MTLHLHNYSHFYLLHDTRTDHYWSGQRDATWYYTPTPAPKGATLLSPTKTPTVLDDVDYALLNERQYYLRNDLRRVAPVHQRSYTPYVRASTDRLYRILRVGLFCAEIELYIPDTWKVISVFTEELTDTTPAEEIDWIEAKLLY